MFHKPTRIVTWLFIDSTIFRYVYCYIRTTCDNLRPIKKTIRTVTAYIVNVFTCRVPKSLFQSDIGIKSYTMNKHVEFDIFIMFAKSSSKYSRIYFMRFDIAIELNKMFAVLTSLIKHNSLQCLNESEFHFNRNKRVSRNKFH